MINTITSDLEALETAVTIGFMFLLPFSVICAIAFLCSLIGWVGLVMVALYLIFCVLSIYVGKFIVYYRIKVAEHGDKRSTLL
jgi:hypothetical protein